jgi:hypothetical protein
VEIGFRTFFFNQNSKLSLWSSHNALLLILNFLKGIKRDWPVFDSTLQQVRRGLCQVSRVHVSANSPAESSNNPSKRILTVVYSS